MSRALLVTSLVLATSLPGARAADAPLALRRFALLIGANDGGPERIRLRYATSDAQAMARVLEELGGVAKTDVTMVLDPDATTLAKALATLGKTMASARAPSQRIELLLYYSGHSDDLGLLLRGERFGYDELRRALDKAPADVRVAILDSCSSGALTRQKGGVRRAPFLMDGAAAVRGHAFLTSSSEHEAAQESDRIQASYFTHYLISGLRGAADATPDGRVTLNEAYQYAFAETLRQTEKTQAGAQHPAYDIQLQGTGDLVMTDLRATSASLGFAAELSGRFYVHDADEHLVAELYKPVGRPVELGLAPGTYSVRLDRREELFETTVILVEGDHRTLGGKDLKAVTRELTARRGDASPRPDVEDGTPPAPAEADVELEQAIGRRTAMTGRRGPDILRTADGDEYPIVPLSFSVLPSISTAPSNVVKSVSVNLLAGRSARVHGVELGVGYNRIDEELRGMQLVLGLNEVDGDIVGWQSAVGANLAYGRLVGFQQAVGYNIAGGGKLFQAAAGFNIVQSDLVGFQAAALFNRLHGPGKGMQVAGLFNDADMDLVGVQAAGLLNLGHGELTGVQAAGLYNQAGSLRGAQLALVNVSGDVTGTQLGLFNLADKVHGAQVGLINVATESDASIGLASFVANGSNHLELWTSSDEALGVGTRFGSRRFYTLLYVSSMRRDVVSTGQDDLLFGLGLGAHLRIDTVFVDFDLSNANTVASWRDSNGSLNLSRARLTVGFAPQAHLAFFVSAVANVMVGYRQDLPDLPGHSLLGVGPRVWKDGDTTIRAWPGLIIGMRI